MLSNYCWHLLSCEIPERLVTTAIKSQALRCHSSFCNCKCKLSCFCNVFIYRLMSPNRNVIVKQSHSQKIYNCDFLGGNINFCWFIAFAHKKKQYPAKENHTTIMFLFRRVTLVSVWRKLFRSRKKESSLTPTQINHIGKVADFISSGERW